MNIENINTWQFGTDNDKLIELVLNGTKKATTSLLNDYKEKEEIPKPGDLGILIFNNETFTPAIKVSKLIFCLSRMFKRIFPLSGVYLRYISEPKL